MIIIYLKNGNFLKVFYYIPKYHDMALIHPIQVFLKRKFIENKLKAKEFARESNIPYNTIFKITKAVQLNPELKTIRKIADYFKCSI